MRARVAPLVVAAVTVLTFAGGACSSDDDDSADPTLPTQPAATTTTVTGQPADPYAVPAVIDEAYVNRVLAALDQINGDVVREVISSRSVSIDSVERIRAVYNDPEFEVELNGLRRLLKNDLTRFRDPPGNRKTVVRQINVARRDCVALEALVDFSEVVRDPAPAVGGEYEAITLRPTQPGADPQRLNPTGWSVGHDEVVEPGAVPKDPLCEGR